MGGAQGWEESDDKTGGCRSTLLQKKMKRAVIAVCSEAFSFFSCKSRRAGRGKEESKSEDICIHRTLHVQHSIKANP